jgi:DNA-directed RNA polymerase subunit omega
MVKNFESVDSKYKFVVIASQRSEQLVDGAKQKVESSSRKPTVVAQEEVLEGLIPFYHEDENPPEEEESKE